MTITNQTVAEKIAAFLHHELTVAQLVDWAEHALLDGEFDETSAAALASVVARLGVADVRAFGLTWEDCEDVLQQLGYSAKVAIVAA
jgi:cobyrinic acid a,c-diamide synthase